MSQHTRPSATIVDGTVVEGVRIDAQTRCAHWHGPTDRVALRFHCCGRWFACFECHRALAGHAPERWPANRHDARAVLCGACGHRLRIAEYLAGESCALACPACAAPFNSGCVRHRHLYFEVRGPAPEASDTQPAD